MKHGCVGVLMGGMGPEREVSNTSGHAVLTALRERGHRAIGIDVTHELDRTLRAQPIDVAFIALHGSYGEDGCVQGLLEFLRIPYTGPSVALSALCMDKLHTKELLRFHGIPTPDFYCVKVAQLREIEQLHAGRAFPVFVKPRSQGSSVGAGRADDLTTLRTRCEQALSFGDDALVETYTAGRELAVGLMDGQALGTVEIVPKAGEYDYHAKYTKGETDYHCPPRLPSDTIQALQRVAQEAVQAVGLPGAPRVDLIWSEDRGPMVLEINTLPGMTSTSLMPMVARQAGMDFGDLCEAILARAGLNIGAQPTAMH